MKWTPEQDAAIHTLGMHLCVDAGAGSGKTSVLIERMLHLLDTPPRAGLDEIVAITFTDKAAAEMKARLRRECRRRAPVDDPVRQSFWRGIERRTDTARISTIHAFCMGLIKEHALTLGIDPDFGILMDAEDHLLRIETVTNTIHDLLDAGDPPARHAAVELGIGRLVKAVLQMLRQRPGLRELAGSAPLDNPDALLDHWNTRLQDEHARRLGTLSRNPVLADASRRLHALAGCCSDAGDRIEVLRATLQDALDTIAGARDSETEIIETQLEVIFDLTARGGSKPKWTSEDDMAEVKVIFGEIKDVLKPYRPEALDPALEARAAELTTAVYSVYARAAQALDDAKAARIKRDFDDLILDAIAVLKEREDLRERIARGMKYLLIDEFQDTDHRQLDMALMLAQVEGGPELFFVGDAKQSIYYFRGAEVEVFKEAQGRAGKTIALDTNFRSSPGVMAFVNGFFRASNLLDAVETDYHGMQTHREDPGGPSVEFLVPSEIEGAKTTDYRRAEARLIAARIAQYCAPGSALSVYDPRTDASRDAQYGDVAMLLRSMSDVYLYEQALRAAGVPYTVVSGRGFFERQEVTDVRNLLAAIVDPWDEMALLGLLRGPIACLSDDDLVRLCSAGPLPKVLAGELAVENLDAPERLRDTQVLLAHLRARTEMPLPAFLRYVLECTGYEALVLNQYLGVQKAANVRKLVDMAEGFANGEASSLGAFLRYLDDVASEALPEGEAGAVLDDAQAVTIMTIHKSKGLEFPIVVIPDTGRKVQHATRDMAVFHGKLGLAVKVTDDAGETYSPGMFRAIVNRHAEQESAEHARIGYVAMTRARDRLLIGGAPDPGRASWLAAFDEVFGVLACGNGETRERDGWSFQVWRDLEPASGGRKAETAAPAQLGTEAAVRANPIATVVADRKRFSVTEVAAAIAERTAAPHRPPAEQDDAREPSPIPAVVRGDAVHAYLERWGFDAFDADLAERVVRETGLSLPLQADLMADLRATADRLAAHPAAKAIAADPAARHELPFALRLDDALLEGKIDVLLGSGGIMDYKTGSRHPHLEEQYLWQLRLYAAAVARIDGAASPEASLFYVDSGECVAVDVSPGAIDDALQRAREAVAALRNRAIVPLLDAPCMVGIV